MPRNHVLGWMASLVAILLALVLFDVAPARDAALAVLGDDLRNDLVAFLSDMTARQPATADLVPIAHADQNPFAINVFLEQEVEEWKIRRTLEMVHDAGFRMIKQQVLWSEIEIPGKGYYVDEKNDVANTRLKYDRIVDLAHEYGLELVLRLDTSPAWARPGNPKEETPPDRFEDYGDFVHAVVSRYKGRVRYYQIWNEPNLAFEWGGRKPDASAYVRLLSIAYARAKEADPAAVIIAAALAPTVEESERGTDDLIFLQRMYDAGASRWFDILSVNAYGLRSGPDDRRLDEEHDVNFSRPILTREVMVRNGDAGKAIWASEMGWNALPPDFQGEAPWGRVTRERQASYTVRAYQRMQQEWPWLGVATLWHFRMVHDVNRDKPQYYFGIVGNDFTPLPAYDAMKALATAEPTLNPGYHQETHWALKYTGQWQRQEDDPASLGGLFVDGVTGDTLRFSFIGSDLDVVAKTDAESGRLAVQIDHGAYAANRLPHVGNHAYLDFSSAQTQWQQRLAIARGLPWSKHEVEMRIEAGPTGGSRVAIDGIVVAGAPANVPRIVLGLVVLALVLACWRLPRRLWQVSLFPAWAHVAATRVAKLTLSSRGANANFVAVGVNNVGARLTRDVRPDPAAGGWLERRGAISVAMVIAVVLLGWALRVYRLDAQSLWYDEGTSAALAVRSIAAITADSAGDIHPPLYYYVLHFWATVAGTSGYALRLLSACFGLVTICLTYCLGRRLFGREIGLVAGLLAAVSPVLIYYSQEARMYQQVTALAALSIYSVARLSAARDRANGKALWPAYFLSSAAMLYSHYFAFTVMLAQNAYFFGRWVFLRIGDRGSESDHEVPDGGHGALRPEARSAPSLASWLVVQVLLVIVFLPWLAVAFGQLVSWPAVSAPLALGTLLHSVFRVFTFGVAWDSSYTPRREAAIAILVLASPLGLLLGRTAARSRHILLLVSYALTPVLVMYVLSLQRPMYNPKFLLLAAPGFYIILAAGVVGIVRAAQYVLGWLSAWRMAGIHRVLHGVVLLAALAVFLYPTSASMTAYYFDPKLARDDYRGLAQYMAENASARDAIVLDAPGQIEIFDYYYRGTGARYPLPRQRPIDEGATADDLTAIWAEHSRVWLVLWAVNESDPRGMIEQWLNRRATKEVDRAFGSVRLLRYDFSTQATGLLSGDESMHSSATPLHRESD